MFSLSRTAARVRTANRRAQTTKAEMSGAAYAGNRIAARHNAAVFRARQKRDAQRWRGPYQSHCFISSHRRIAHLRAHALASLCCAQPSRPSCCRVRRHRCTTATRQSRPPTQRTLPSRFVLCCLCSFRCFSGGQTRRLTVDVLVPPMSSNALLILFNLLCCVAG